jgi:hypothetical protein
MAHSSFAMTAYQATQDALHRTDTVVRSFCHYGKQPLILKKDGIQTAERLLCFDLIGCGDSRVGPCAPWRSVIRKARES